MARGTPSMVALLGLLAVAGYKNRDKIKEMLAGQPDASAGAGLNPRAGQPGGLGGLGSLLGGLGAGGLLSGGLGELVERLKSSGQGQAADSWISTGPNQPLAPDQLEKAIGPDVIDSLTQHTGLSRDELLSRLTRDLPDAVNEFTPQGHLPNEAEAQRLL
jgi:uncharacterized protein YidB (DUF937 family)